MIYIRLKKAVTAMVLSRDQSKFPQDFQKIIRLAFIGGARN